MENNNLDEFKIAEKFDHTELLVWKEKKVILIRATAPYIPMEEFKEVFTKATEIIGRERLTKTIFDKTQLTVFHQPSMEWYFIVWKEELLTKYGVRMHRKILPDNNVFVQSVKLGRMKIEKNFPDGKYKEMDIQYAKSVMEAVEM